MDELKTYDVILCPLCEYVTGVAWSQYGPANARGALASHLHRKKHGLTRAEALALAKAQPVMVCVFDVRTHQYLRFTAREKPEAERRGTTAMGEPFVSPRA